MVLDAKKNSGIKKSTQFGLKNGKSIIDDFFTLTPYNKIQVTFSGGEPLIYFKQFVQPMVLYIREKEKITNKEVIIDMFTNGTLLDEEKLLFFRKHNIKIGISYDGHCGQKYRDEKTQQTVEEKIKLTMSIAPELLSIASTFYKDTLSMIFDAFQSVKNFGVKRWSFAIDTLSTGGYDLEHIETFGKQAKMVWDELQTSEIECRTFQKINGFTEYCEGNRAILVRPNGELCIGTTVPILIPDYLFKHFSIGFYKFNFEKLAEYNKIMGDFHVHVIGKNNQSYCDSCKVKKQCQEVHMTSGERQIRAIADPMHCLFYLILSHIMEGTW